MKRTLLRSVAAAATAASLVFTATACANNAGSADAGKGADASSIRMGTQPWLGYGLWYVAEDQGYFTEEGLNVTIDSFDTDADVNAALASGKLDMASVASHTALQFIENGVDVTIVAVLDAATTADAIIVDDSINSVADLKGKKIAYEEGATSELLLGDVLDQNGMTFDDVDKVPMGADEAGTALIAGQVPAAVTYEPYVSTAVNQGDNVKVLTSAAEHEGLISDVLVVRNDVLKEKKEAVEDVIDAWDESYDYYQSNTADAQRIVAEGVGSNVDELKTAFDGVHYYSIDENETFLTGEYVKEVLPAIIKVAANIGMLKGDADPAKAVDDSYL